MAKKNKFPKTVFGVRTTDLGDDPVVIVFESLDEIPEEYADQQVGVYELRAVGKFEVEKSINGKALKVGKK